MFLKTNILPDLAAPRNLILLLICQLVCEPSRSIFLDLDHFEVDPDLIRGEFLHGFRLPEGRGFDEWVLIQRERLGSAARLSLRTRISDLRLQGAYHEALGFARRAATLDPFDEPAARHVIELLVRNNQLNAALREYRNLGKLLMRELGVEPSWKTQELFHWIRDLPTPPVTHLPEYPSKFIGRKSKLDIIEDMLIAPTQRLITIVGPGGVGKTRFAVKAARHTAVEHPGRYLNGIAFVALEGVSAAGEIPDRIGDALDFRWPGLDDRRRELLDFLRDKELLLIFDNFEQLLAAGEDAPALVTDIIAYCPRAKIIVTTRERLNHSQETIFPLDGLDVIQDVEDNAASESVQLFVQSAQRVHPSYMSNKQDQFHIAHICREIDGNPLAIELIASSIRLFSSAELRRRLETNITLLETPNRDAAERHRSLAAVFEHSWDLLSEEQQRTLAQISLFQGPFETAAARAVVQTRV